MAKGQFSATYGPCNSQYNQNKPIPASQRVGHKRPNPYGNNEDESGRKMPKLNQYNPNVTILHDNSRCRQLIQIQPRQDSVIQTRSQRMSALT